MKTRGPTLMSALGFNEQDLAANRDGRLGRHQLRSARVTAIIWIAMGSLFLVAMGAAVFAQLGLDDPNVGGAIFAVVLAIVVGGFCLLVGVLKLAERARRRGLSRIVQRLSRVVRATAAAVRATAV